MHSTCNLTLQRYAHQPQLISVVFPKTGLRGSFHSPHTITARCTNQRKQARTTSPIIAQLALKRGTARHTINAPALVSSTLRSRNYSTKQEESQRPHSRSTRRPRRTKPAGRSFSLFVIVYPLNTCIARHSIPLDAPAEHSLVVPQTSDRQQ